MPGATISAIFLNRYSEKIRLYRDMKTWDLVVNEYMSPNKHGFIKELTPKEYGNLVKKGQVKYVGALKEVYDSLEKHLRGDKVLIEESDRCEICRKKKKGIPLCYVDCQIPQNVYILIGDVKKYLKGVEEAILEGDNHTREELIKSNNWRWDQVYLIKIPIQELLGKNFKSIERIRIIPPLKEVHYDNEGNPVGITTHGSYQAEGVLSDVMEKIDNRMFFRDYKSHLEEMVEEI